MTTKRGDAGLPDLLFLVGAPRSGTTWLQLLLARHPSVATTKESHLFDGFVGPALRNWDLFEADPRAVGLAPLISRDEFVERLRCFAGEALGRLARDETRLILDKTPDHALWCEALLTVFPAARIVHLVRDPRDVGASLLAAGASWGRAWAPGTAYEAAWRWCEHVRGARAAAALTDGFREVRYEDLLEGTEEELDALLDWLSLERPEGFVAETVANASLDRMKSGETKAPWDLGSEPGGFVRKGGSGNWKSELSRSQVRVIEYVCGELMEPLRYEKRYPAWWPPLGFFPPWLRDQLSARLRDR